MYLTPEEYAEICAEVDANLQRNYDETPDDLKAHVRIHQPKVLTYEQHLRIAQNALRGQHLFSMAGVTTGARRNWKR